ncbi:MAG: hypothetical protein L6R38_009312 [Xanthoria sp. 2 TBL-2021]|nr:MAG: hypothetical protein L6R38_009312 [Xanthoria sp. 2 TBL-2021]
MSQPEQSPQPIAEPRVTNSSNRWDIVEAEHFNHPERPEEFRGFYLLAGGAPAQQEILIISTKFSSNTSPFTFYGAVCVKPDDLAELDHPDRFERLTNFHIEGNGTSYDTGEGTVTFVSEFHIVEGTGTKKFEGITGSGRLGFVLSGPGSGARGAGFCFFDNMNSVGASLM